MGDPIATARLILEPVTPELAHAILDGELAALRHAPDWPHADTLDGVRLGGEMWLVVSDGVVVGDVGTHGPPDANGDVEIGFGLAESVRRQGFASEFVPALARHLLARADVRRVVAEPDGGNVASCRTLERAGFALEGGCYVVE